MNEYDNMGSGFRGFGRQQQQDEEHSPRGGGGPARKSPQQDSAPTSPASANYDSDDIENVYEEEEDI